MDKNIIYSFNDDKKVSKQGKKDYIDISSGKRSYNISIRWGKLFSIIFFLILGIFGGALIYTYNMLYSFNYQELEIGSTEDESQFGYSDNNDAFINDNMILNVLLLGTDSQSAGDGGRSDTILLLSLDARHKKLKIISLMRDLWVKIPGHSQDRLNAAYAYGGAKLTIDTIKNNFGIKTDRYALVDFDNFAHIVDSIGGIDINLTSAETSYINKNSKDKNILKGSGKMHLNGAQALTHSRNRDSIGSDYDRTERQRNVIMAIFDKAKTLNIGQITKLISTVAPMVTTNLKSSEIARLASNALNYLKFSVEQFRLPTDDNVKNETINHKMVLVISDAKKAKQDILKFIYEDQTKAAGLFR